MIHIMLFDKIKLVTANNIIFIKVYIFIVLVFYIYTVTNTEGLQQHVLQP